STVLGANTSVRSLRVQTPSAVTIGGTNNLTIGSYGLHVLQGSGATTINSSGQVILGANQTWITSGDLAVSSAISGGASLTKIGDGALTLTGTNLYTGPTTISAGVLYLGSGGTSGGLLGSIVNNGGLLVNRSNDVTLDGVIS